MDAKIIAYISILSVAIGITFFVHETMEIDDAKRELAIADQQIKVTEDQIKNMSASLELRREIAALLKAADIMKQEAETIRGETEGFRKDEVNSRKTYHDAIRKIRLESAGLELPQFTLSTGAELKGARIQRVEGTTTTILHSEGISKLTPDVLPKELQDRFLFGTLAEDNATAKVVVKTIEPVSTTGNKNKLNEARLNAEKLKKELPYLEEELAKITPESLAASSATRRFYTKNRMDVLNQQIIALKRKIDAATLEVTRLESEQVGR